MRSKNILISIISFLVCLSLLLGISLINQKEETDYLRGQLDLTKTNLQKAEANESYWEGKAHMLEEATGVYEQ